MALFRCCWAHDSSHEDPFMCSQACGYRHVAGLGLAAFEQCRHLCDCQLGGMCQPGESQIMGPAAGSAEVCRYSCAISSQLPADS